ncbi:hypothetical protein LTR60_006412, partial [Cryomyces antarcticus]
DRSGAERHGASVPSGNADGWTTDSAGREREKRQRARMGARGEDDATRYDVAPHHNGENEGSRSQDGRKRVGV